MYPRAGSNVFEHSVYLVFEPILPLFIDYSRIDIIFNSCKSQDLKAFMYRYDDKNMHIDP